MIQASAHVGGPGGPSLSPPVSPEHPLWGSAGPRGGPRRLFRGRRGGVLRRSVPLPPGRAENPGGPGPWGWRERGTESPRSLGPSGKRERGTRGWSPCSRGRPEGEDAGAELSARTAPCPRCPPGPRSPASSLHGGHPHSHCQGIIG